MSRLVELHPSHCKAAELGDSVKKRKVMSPKTTPKNSLPSPLPSSRSSYLEGKRCRGGSRTEQSIKLPSLPQKG